MYRQQQQAIIDDLSKKIVILVGPRQVGKTWLAKEIGKQFQNTLYLSYDRLEDRQIMLDEAWLASSELLIFDELHKMPHWKNYLKGIYDTKPSHTKILVTGSARLDTFTEFGDSLAGRFFMHRLMPFSPAELSKISYPYALDQLIKRGGFPEPFLATNDVDADRWRLQYIDSVLRTDVFDFEAIQNIRAIYTVFELLRRRVGSPVSYQSLSEDVNISPQTVKKYIHILEALYIVFRVTPYSKNIARSLLKEPKIYFYDTGLILGDEDAKTENLTAVCLLKHVFAKQDYFGQRYELGYIRTKEKQEIDFALIQDDEIQQLVEVKHTDHRISKHLLQFRDKYNLPIVQVVKELKREKMDQGIPVLDLKHYLENLDL